MLTVSACSDAAEVEEKYHDGLLYLATGNTTGVYYQFGGGYAGLVTQYLSGYRVDAEPTGASGDNIARVNSGDMDLALSHADIAADGALGAGIFAGTPQRIVALARLYDNIAQVVVRSSSKIRTVADLKGKRVSTGTLNSGTDIVSGRMLEAAGLDPENDLTRLRLSLSDTVKGIEEGTIDAFVFVAGLPVTGIAELMTSHYGQYAILSVNDVLPAMNETHNGIYQEVTIPKSMYNTSADIVTIAIPTMLICSPDIPDQLAYDLTEILFEHQEELAKAHADGANFTQSTAELTTPVTLHPGAQKYYDQV